MATKTTLNKFVQKSLSFYQENGDEENQENIQRLIASTEDAQILQAIELTATQNEEKLVQFLKAVCYGLNPENPASRAKRRKLIRTSIELLRGGRLENHIASGVLCVLFTEIDFLNSTDVIELLKEYKRAFERGLERHVGSKYVDAFTKLLHALDHENCDDGEIPGKKLKEKFMKEFCQPRGRNSGDSDGGDDEKTTWHPTSVVHILMALKDAFLDAEYLHLTVLKTIELLPEIDLEEVPDVVYELLKLAKGPECSAALNGICDFFTAKDKEYLGEQGDRNDAAATSANEWELWRRCQGFVILHIMLAVQQSHDTGRMLLNVLKTKGQDLIHPFSFGLLLAVTHVNKRIKDQYLEMAKTTILHFLKIAEKKENAAWIRSHLRFTVDFEKLIKELAETNQIELGWEYSLIGLRELGFALLESHLPKLIILSNGKLCVDSPSAAGYNACLLGKSIIYKCFSAYNLEMRQAVIKRIFDLITIPSSTGTSSALFFIEVLCGLVIRGMSAFTAYEEFIVEQFEHLPSLPYEVGVPLLKALLPVFKLKPTLRDALVMALKKALFSRAVEAKKTAVGGFLLFLKHFKILNAFQSKQNDPNRSVYYHSFPTFGSQVLTDVKTDPHRASYERLCLEVIGCLKRTLALQGELKEILYHGLYLVVRRNENTLQPVLDFLYRHFQNYLCEPDIMPPFKLQNCVQELLNERVVTMETFGWLVCSMTRILKQAEDDKVRLETAAGTSNSAGGSENDVLYFNYETVKSVGVAIENLSKSVARADLEDFSIDKSADFSPTVAGEKNLNMARVLLSTYEALIGFLFAFFDFSSERANIVVDLHGKYLELNKLVQERTVTKGKKATVAAGTAATVPKPKPFDTSVKIDVSPLDLTCILDICKRLLCDQSPNRREGLAPLRENDDLISWIFETTLAKIKNLSSRRKVDTSKTFEIICKISALMHQYYADDGSVIVEMKRARLKKLKVVALDVISAVLNVVNQQFVDKLEVVLQIWSSAFDPQSQSSSQQFNSSLAAYGRTFQRHLKDLLIKRAEGAAIPRRGAGHRDNADDDDVQDELSPTHLSKLVAVIDSIWKHLPVKSDEFKTAYGSILRLCQEQTIRDPAVAKALWQLLIQMHRRMDGTGNLALALAANIRYRFGDLDETDNVPEPEVAYASIDERTVSAVSALFLHTLSDYRDDCVFMIDYVRQNAAAAKAGKDPSWSPKERLDNKLCDHLHALAQVWLELIKSMLPGLQIQTVIKSLRSVFDAFTRFLRYYCLLHQSKLGALTPKFVDFAKFVGSDLIATVYKFIGYSKCNVIEPATGKGKNKNATAVRQAIRETKDVPSLIFALETFKKCLIELSAKTKNKKLVERMCVGHNRDFKLDFDKMEKALHPQEHNGMEELDNSGTSSNFRLDDCEEVHMISDSNTGETTRSATKRKTTESDGKAQKRQKSTD